MTGANYVNFTQLNGGTDLIERLETRSGTTRYCGDLGESEVVATALLDEAAALIRTLQADKRRMEEALGVADKAMTVWLCTYASDMVSEEDVAEAYGRIRDHGGTLGFISAVDEVIARAALNREPGT